MFVDVETTGLEQADVLCSIGLLYEEQNSLHVKYDLVNEGKKIPPLASSINNITNEMITEKPRFEQTECFKILSDNIDKSLLIAHNVSFEMMILAKYGFDQAYEFIDTLRVTRHLINDLESYSLNFLRYEMKLYRKEKTFLEKLGIEEKKLCPHDAFSDVIITKLLFDELLELSSVEEMKELSIKPVLMQKFEFGKYSGRYIEEIAMSDRGYLEWMLHTIEDLSEDMRYSLEYYL